MAKRTKHEEKHMDSVAKLGCLICRKEGNYFSPCELHHIRDMTLGMGRNPLEVIPLCIPHHRTGKESFHENSKGFSKKWGSQRSLLKEVLELLENGCCKECA